MTSTQQYRIRNWNNYNKSLVNRGSRTLWFDEESIKNWHQVTPNGHRGHIRFMHFKTKHPVDTLFNKVLIEY